MATVNRWDGLSTHSSSDVFNIKNLIWIFVVASITIHFAISCYMAYFLVSTQNSKWEDDQSFCISQYPLCQNLGEAYSTRTDTSHCATPICQNENGNCFHNDEDLQCVYRYNITEMELDEKYGNRTLNNFPTAKVIALLCMSFICIALHLLWTLRFSYEGVKRFTGQLSRMISFTEIFIIIIMVLPNELKMRTQVLCASDDHLCYNFLIDCSAMIISIIHPDDILITSFSKICVSLGLCLSIVKVSQLVILVHTSRIGLMDNISENTESRELTEARVTGGWPARTVVIGSEPAYVNTAHVVSGTVGHLPSQVMPNDWREIAPGELAEHNTECSICLQSFSTTKLKPQPPDATLYYKATKVVPVTDEEALIPSRPSPDLAADTNTISGIAGREKENMSIIQVPCGHKFHKQCILRWHQMPVNMHEWEVRVRPSCPECRAPLINQ